MDVAITLVNARETRDGAWIELGLRVHEGLPEACANAGQSRESVYPTVLDWPAGGGNWPAGFTGAGAGRYRR